MLRKKKFKLIKWQIIYYSNNVESFEYKNYFFFVTVL